MQNIKVYLTVNNQNEPEGYQTTITEHELIHLRGDVRELAENVVAALAVALNTKLELK